MKRRRWTSNQDDLLITEGRLHGYAHVARHNLDRSPSAARSRMRRLRRKYPDRVKRMEACALSGLLA